LTSREIIRRVLACDHPPRIGLTFSAHEGTPRISDVVGVGPAADPGLTERRWHDEAGGECWTDEWGCTWRRLPGKTKGGETVETPIRTWDDLASYTPPTVADPFRYVQAAKSRSEHPDHYCLGGITACAFDRARYLRGLETYLEDCAAEPARVRQLNDLVSDVVIAQVDAYADLGADGVMFCEDWGTQDRLLVSPAMWRAMFRPYFERLVTHAHARGLTVWMHSCGYVCDIVPDLVEVGVDVLQFDQPDLHGIDALAKYAGRVTYWCPVDIQRTLQSGNEETIRAKAREMVEKLGAPGGGFIAKDYPDEFSIGADPRWQQWAYETFVDSGRYEQGP